MRWRILLFSAIAIARIAVAQDPDRVPDMAPDTLPSWVFSPVNRDTNTALFGRTAFSKNVVMLQFLPAAARDERQAAVDAVHGRVIGGIPGLPPERMYCVWVPDSLHGAGLNRAVTILKTMPGVAFALINFFAEPQRP